MHGRSVVLAALGVAVASVAWASEPAGEVSPRELDRVLHWTGVLAGIYAAVHVIGPRLWPWLDAREAQAGSFGGGMAVAYAFLHLLPELDEGHEILGDSIHLVVLLGLVLFYGLERQLVLRHRARPAEEPSTFVFSLHLAFGCVYNWLLVYSTPTDLREHGGRALIGAVAIVVHLIFRDRALAEIAPRSYVRWGRFVLALAPLAGWATDLVFVQTDPVIVDVLTALLAGAILQAVFKDEIPAHHESRFGWFLVGIALYAGLERIS